MKKLMCAIAAVAAGVAMADTEVTSANIVGYTTVTVEKQGQQKMVGANFISVGKEAVDLQDIGLVGDDGSYGASYIMWWDVENKTWGGSANYVNDVYVGGEATGKPGWGDEVEWERINKTFAPGEGFWFYPAFANVGITISGEIADADQDYIGRNVEKLGQQIMVVNAYPTALDIQDLYLIGDDGSYGASYIMWWDVENKTWGGSANYVNDVYVGGEATGKPGWGDEVEWERINHSFDAGEGFWFYPAFADVTICFPNPLKKTVEEK